MPTYNPDFGRLKSSRSRQIRIGTRINGTVPAGVHGEPLPVRDDALLQHGGCPLQPRLSVSSLRELPSSRAQVPILRPGTSWIWIHFRSEYFVWKIVPPPVVYMARDVMILIWENPFRRAIGRGGT
jgi:hypothetical protein